MRIQDLLLLSHVDELAVLMSSWSALDCRKYETKGVGKIDTVCMFSRLFGFLLLEPH